MELTKEQQETFKNLQKPTMELISSFYKMPKDVKSFFANMMAVYEANPTKETADALFDKVMGKESSDAKEAWMAEQVKKVPLSTRKSAVRKYLTQMQAVPKGVPASGMVMTGLGVISREEKDILMEMQASARLISHVDVLDNYKPKTNYQNEDGSFENAFLDKPFATRIQRMEHLVNAVVNDIYTFEEEHRIHLNETGIEHRDPYLDESFTKDSTKFNCERDVFLQKARNEAIDTLNANALKLKKANPKLAEQVTSLAGALDQRDSLYERMEGFKMSRAFIEKMPEARNKDSWAADGFDYTIKSIAHRLDTEKAALYPLMKEDFDNLKKATKGRPIEGLVKHRADQILPSVPVVNEAVLKKVPLSLLAKGGRG